MMIGTLTSAAAIIRKPGLANKPIMMFVLDYYQLGTKSKIRISKSETNPKFKSRKQIQNPIRLLGLPQYCTKDIHQFGAFFYQFLAFAFEFRLPVVSMSESQKRDSFASLREILICI